MARSIETVQRSETDVAGRPARYDRRRPTRRTLSVILPTYNEAENLPILVGRLTKLLVDVDYEIIVVDDNSPDRTWEVAEDLERQSQRIRSIRRVDDRGLSSAVIAGMQVADGQVFVVMDSDLQHDEQIVLDLVSPVLDGDADIAVGSREAEGGSYGEWGRGRRLVSWGGKQLARQALGVPIDDPMSGFFAVSRDRFEAIAGDINPRGFKILLEFLARGPKPRAVEVGYEFRERVHGATKLTGSVVGAYLLALIDLLVGRVVSATFTAYAIVGLIGLGVRFGSESALQAIGASWATFIAVECSVLSNYWFNNRFTFARDRRRRLRFFTGLLPFHLVAGHGLIVQLGVEAAVEEAFDVTSSVSALLFGVLVATTGNYFLNSTITWRPSS